MTAAATAAGVGTGGDGGGGGRCTGLCPICDLSEVRRWRLVGEGAPSAAAAAVVDGGGVVVVVVVAPSSSDCLVRTLRLLVCATTTPPFPRPPLALRGPVRPARSFFDLNRLDTVRCVLDMVAHGLWLVDFRGSCDQRLLQNLAKCCKWTCNCQGSWIQIASFGRRRPDWCLCARSPHDGLAFEPPSQAAPARTVVAAVWYLS